MGKSVAPGITVETLARAKGLPPQLLREFGVADEPRSVRIQYVKPDGAPARSRHRKAIGGAANSWWGEEDREVTAYWHPLVPKFVRRRRSILVVEGESSCWTAWHGGFGAVGIPGSDHVDVLGLDHLASSPLALVVVEPDDRDTFPLGVAHYTNQVRERLHRIGYPGEVALLHLDGVAADVPALYQAEPATFADRLASLIGAAAAATRP